jgi:hypothetical protein
MPLRGNVLIAGLVVMRLWSSAAARQQTNRLVLDSLPEGVRQASTDPVYASLFPASTASSTRANWVPPTPTASPMASSPPTVSSPAEKPTSSQTDNYDVTYVVEAKATKLSDKAVQAISNESAKATGTVVSAWELSSKSAKTSSSGSSTTLLRYNAALPTKLGGESVIKLTSFNSNGGMLAALAAYSLADGITAIALDSASQLSPRAKSSNSGGPSRVGIIVGCIVAIIFLAAVTVFLVKYVRRRQFRLNSFDEKAVNAAPPDFDDSHFGPEVARTTSALNVNPIGNLLDISKQHRIAKWQEGASAPVPASVVANRKIGGVGSQRSTTKYGADIDESLSRSYLAAGTGDAGRTSKPIDVRVADDTSGELRGNTGPGGSFRAPNGIPRLNTSSEYNESVRALSDYAGSSSDLMAGPHAQSWDKDGNERSSSGCERQGAGIPTSRNPSASFVVGRLHPGQYSGRIDYDDNKRYRR